MSDETTRLRLWLWRQRVRWAVRRWRHPVRRLLACPHCEGAGSWREYWTGEYDACRECLGSGRRWFRRRWWDQL